MAIQAVFRSVILARLLYASPAWWGFAGAQDRQKVYSFLWRSARVGFYSSDSSSFDDLCIQADQSLFNKVLHNPDHVLHLLLPPIAHTSHNYCLRPCAHDRSLPKRLTHLTDCNFIYYPYAILSSLLIVFNVCMFSLSCSCILTVVKYTDMLCYGLKILAACIYSPCATDTGKQGELNLWHNAPPVEWNVEIRLLFLHVFVAHRLPVC